jgi:hypothetical protein
MAIVGSLLDISLIDLLQVFTMSGKTGKLIIELGEQSSGMLWIVDGNVANAATIDAQTRAPMYMGEEAVVEMLQWEDAKFRFIPPIPGESYKTTIARPTEWLILEGLRHRDEQVSKPPSVQLTPGTRLRLLAHPDSANERHNLNREEWIVLTHSANATTIGQLLLTTGFPEVEVYAIIGRLMALRLIDLEPNKARTAVFNESLMGSLQSGKR